MSMAPSSDERLNARFEQVSKLVSDARDVLNQGKMIDLNVLQQEVANLCEAAAGQPEDESQAIGTALTRIIKDLETLAQELQVHIIETAQKKPQAVPGLNSLLMAQEVDDS